MLDKFFLKYEWGGGGGRSNLPPQEKQPSKSLALLGLNGLQFQIATYVQPGNQWLYWSPGSTNKFIHVWTQCCGKLC